MKILGDRLGAIAWVTAGLFALVAIVIGFVWLPSLQRTAQGGLWGDICRALGIYPSERPVLSTTAPEIPTAVVWNVATLQAVRKGDAKHGSTLAAGCAGCHGAKGISPSEAFPNLAGLSADAVYKQLDDYRSGMRQNAIMQAMAAPLTDQDIADLAAHFAGLSPAASASGKAMPSLVDKGIPMRSLAPCAACHGPMGRKHGAPELVGQKASYLKAQLEAFGTGARHNDINQQMREIARALGPAERDALVAWYGEAPPAQ